MLNHFQLLLKIKKIIRIINEIWYGYKILTQPLERKDQSIPWSIIETVTAREGSQRNDTSIPCVGWKGHTRITCKHPTCAARPSKTRTLEVNHQTQRSWPRRLLLSKHYWGPKTVDLELWSPHTVPGPAASAKVGNENSQAPPQTYWPETLGLEPSSLCFITALKMSPTTVKILTS